MNAFLEKHQDKIVTLSESGCMIWTAASTQKGYGIAFAGRISAAGHKIPEGAHRLSYVAENGTIPKGAYVLHRCDVPCCVNPNHLFLGDQLANMQDMAAKGRSPIGSRHGMATMNEDVVRRIRSEYRFHRVTAAMLADRYGLTRSAVAAVVRRQTWKHIK